MKARNAALVGLVAMAAFALAQGWRAPYEKALEAAAAGKWPVARDQFKEAIADRPEDEIAGGVRGPYSANFGAAYSAYQMALAAKPESAPALFTLASQELEVLVLKKRASREAFYVLSLCYSSLGKADEAAKATSQWKAGVIAWKADATFLSAEDQRALAPEKPKPAPPTPVAEPQAKPADPPPRRPEESKPKQKEQPATKPIADDRTKPVAVSPNKFALLVGNSQSPISDLAVPFAADNVGYLRDALVRDAGYDPSNVTTLTDATSQQLVDAARALAARLPEQGVVLLYFAGVGVNVEGNDYLAGIESPSSSDVGTMVRKSQLIQLFVERGARIFAFFECARPRVNKAVFGQEPAILGNIAQTYGTISGQTVYSSLHEGKQIGLFAKAMGVVLREFRSNAVPVSDFVWEVFYSMRRGGQQGTGGGSLQTPTLPVIINMPSESRF